MRNLLTIFSFLCFGTFSLADNLALQCAVSTEQTYILKKSGQLELQHDEILYPETEIEITNNSFEVKGLPWFVLLNCASKEKVQFKDDEIVSNCSPITELTRGTLQGSRYISVSRYTGSFSAVIRLEVDEGDWHYLVEGKCVKAKKMF